MAYVERVEFEMTEVLDLSTFINPPIWFELPTVGSPYFRITGHLPITVNRSN
jgi:hypothetical protein